MLKQSKDLTRRIRHPKKLLNFVSHYGSCRPAVHSVDLEMQVLPMAREHRVEAGVTHGAEIIPRFNNLSNPHQHCFQVAIPKETITYRIEHDHLIAAAN